MHIEDKIELSGSIARLRYEANRLSKTDNGRPVNEYCRKVVAAKLALADKLAKQYRNG